MSRFEQFQKSRVAKIEQAISNLDDAIVKVTADPRAEYEVDTGQTRVRVKQSNLDEIRRLQSALERKLASLTGDNGPERGVLGW